MEEYTKKKDNQDREWMTEEGSKRTEAEIHRKGKENGRRWMEDGEGTKNQILVIKE